PEMGEVEVLLAEHHAEVVQRRMVRPDPAGRHGLARRDRQHEQVIHRDHRPQEHRDADQDQSRLVEDFVQLHLESLFIMKYTSGSTSGSAITIEAMARSTWSSRR